ncbi:hypothetical protein [Pseudoneobacillus sp. C159]
MDDQLKKLKSTLTETAYKDFQFDTKNRQAVFQKIKNGGDFKKINTKERFHNRFRGLLTVAAYCGMVLLISSFLVKYFDSSDDPNRSAHKNPDPDNSEVVIKDPSFQPEVGDLLDSTSYKNTQYSFELTFPEEWKDNVRVEKLETGVRFFFPSQEDYQQDLFRIEVQKVADRLKTLYEGGPDPSTDIAVLGDNVYRFSTPLDLALTTEEEIQKYGELSSGLPNIIKSFQFMDNKSGNIGDTPYIYGSTSHYNKQYGFEINTPNKWKNMFEVRNSDKAMQLLFTKPGTEPTEFFSILFLSTEEWETLKSSTNKEQEFREITSKDGIVFVAAIVKENPFQDPELLYPFEMLKNEANLVIETFGFLD